MGTGMVLAVSKEDEEQIIDHFTRIVEKAYTIGKVTDDGEINIILK